MLVGPTLGVLENLLEKMDEGENMVEAQKEGNIPMESEKVHEGISMDNDGECKDNQGGDKQHTCGQKR